MAMRHGHEERPCQIGSVSVRESVERQHEIHVRCVNAKARHDIYEDAALRGARAAITTSPIVFM